MREIQLTQGQVAFVDDKDYEWLNSFNWCATKDRSNYYAVRSTRISGKKRNQRMHKLIMGTTPKGMMIDHKDGNSLNNQRNNLRFVTNSQNQMNRTTKNSSFDRSGIWFDPSRNKFEVSITANGVRITKKRFSDINEALLHRIALEHKYFGEFARLNLK